MTAQGSLGKAGYIYKEGAQVLSWKKRFLVIEREKLSYYQKDNKKNKKGEILIRTIKEVKPYNEYKTRKFIFAIITTSRTYYVQGSDDANVASWVTAINGVLAKPATQKSTPAQPTQPTPSTPSTPVQTSHPTPQSTRPASAGNEPEEEEKVTVENFSQLKVIGRGGFGRVLLVRKKDTKKVYAMKILKKSIIAARGEIEHTKTERNVLSRVENPFLAKLHWSFQTDDNLYFIMDFINGGELFHHLSKEKKFSEDRTKFYAAEIVSGLQYLHNIGVIYRDLKPENLLLSHKGHVVMTDFGLSKEGLNSTDATTNTFCGTPEYLAPEIIKGVNYTKAIDWWAVGTLIYEMLTGLPPFYTEDQDNMYHKIMTGELVIPAYFSQEVADIIRQFLQRDPNLRLQDTHKIRSHSWFRNIDWEKLERCEITPPFVPNVKSPDDVRNIDEEFLEEDINASDEDDPNGKGKNSAFGGFTFQANDAGEPDQIMK